jgi:tRNA(adenine34) deaminase
MSDIRFPAPPLPGPVDDGEHMAVALAEARDAMTHEDVPIGAAIVRGGEIVARARNRREADADPTAHAELLALREAGKRLGRWRLYDCALYVTLEPCVMCAGAIVLARVPLVVFGSPDPKAGAVISIAQLFEERGLNHHPKWRMGVRRAECEQMLKDFFAAHRDGVDG